MIRLETVSDCFSATLIYRSVGTDGYKAVHVETWNLFRSFRQSLGWLSEYVVRWGVGRGGAIGTTSAEKPNDQHGSQ